ncbi:YncE family protein, partial [Methanosarcina mazei]
TNRYGTAYGFKIDQVETRNDMAPSGDLPESYHSYANNFNYIWPEISRPEATQMRLHFTKLELDFDDKLILLNKDGNKLVTFKDYNNEDFWTEWYTGNTIKVKLETNRYETAYGFKIDQVEIRTNPESISMDIKETPSSSSAPFAYITNGGSNNVSVIDTVNNTVIAVVDVGSDPFGVAVAPDGTKVYVANMGSNNISVIDTATNSVTDTIDAGINPRGIAVSPDGTKIYVVNSASNNVSVIDTVTNNVTASVTAGGIPYGVAVNPDGKKVYVTNGDIGNENNTVSVIDTISNNVIATVTAGGIPYGVAVTPDGTKVYVANWGSDNVSIIDTASNIVIATVPAGNTPRAFGQFISGSVSTSAAPAGPECKEIKDYLPVYTNGVNLNIINKVGKDILVVWTKADSREPVFKVNILNEQNRTVTTPTGIVDEYIRISYPQEVCSWYRVIQATNSGHTQLESGYDYTVTYYWGSNGTGLTPIPDSEAPE